MKIAIELGNRRLEFKISFEQLETLEQVGEDVEKDTYAGGYVYINDYDGNNAKKYLITPTEPDSLEELMRKHAQEPNQGLVLTNSVSTIPVPNPTPPAKPYISPNRVAEPKLVSCPCVFDDRTITEFACTECAEAGRHSGGCEIEGCEYGYIKAVCWCY